MVNYGLCINYFGDKRWYQNGKYHRMNGPAKDYYGYLCGKFGYKEWWYQGTRIDCSNQEEFDRLIKLRLLW